MINVELFSGYWRRSGDESKLIPPIEQMSDFLKKIDKNQYIDIKETSAGYLLIYSNDYENSN